MGGTGERDGESPSHYPPRLFKSFPFFKGLQVEWESGVSREFIAERHRTSSILSGGETLKKRNQISALPISIRCGPNQRTRKKEEEASGRGEFRTHIGDGMKFAKFLKNHRK